VAAAPIKVLFATRTSPFAGDSGSGTYVFDLLSHLRREDFQIHVAWTEPPDLNPTRGWFTPPPESSAVFSLEIMDTVRVGERFWRSSIVWLPLKARAAHRIKTALRFLGLWRDVSRPRAPALSHAAPISPPSTLHPPLSAAAKVPTWGCSASRSETVFLRSAIRRYRPDVIIANYAWLSPAIHASSTGRRSAFNRQASTTAPAASAVPFAVLTHDVRHRQLHLRDGQLVEVLNEHTPLETELAQLTPADALIAIQSTEAAVFARHFPTKRVVTAPMSAAFRPLPVPNAPVALFVGSGHAPNLTGLRWFLANVWPELCRDLPAVRLLIAGSICSSLTEALPPGVEKLGRLPDLSAAYAQASLVIAPILQGSGIKIKILEALTFGRAVITTSVGAEGLENLRPTLRVADTPGAFARDTLALLRDPALAMSTAATLQALASDHLSPEACYGPVARLLRDLAAGNSSLSA
jgi:glycosyltransferase involved in cell wall biosynthesis